MLMSELINLIKIETTGKLVQFELADADVETLINDGVRTVRAWYTENPRVQTVAVVEDGETPYVDEEDLELQPSYIHDVWSVKSAGSELAAISSVSELLDLPAHVLYYGGTGYEFGDTEYNASAPGQSVYDDWFVTYAQYMSVRPSIENLMAKMEWEWIQSEKKIFVPGCAEDAVTVIYSPLPKSLEELTVDKAIDWVRDYSVAKVKIALARSRGKFRAGGLNFETDASDMLSEANERITALKEELKTLQFINAVER